jgi:hypothetical protein
MIRVKCEAFLLALEDAIKLRKEFYEAQHKLSIEKELAKRNRWRKPFFRKPITELDKSYYTYWDRRRIWMHEDAIEDDKRLLAEAKLLCSLSTDGYIELDRKYLREAGLA